MTPGDAVGRVVIREVLGQVGPVTRCRGVQEDADVEVLVLSSDAPDALRMTFQRVHSELSNTTHPAVVPTQQVLTLPDGRVAAVREWTRIAPAPDDPDAVADALRQLVPAVRSAGTSLLSEAAPRDIRRREDGRYVVGPWGLRTDEDAPYRAPESHSGAPDTPDSALYGLGVWAYQAATQHLPVPAGMRTDEAAPVPPTKWRPDLPFHVAQALIALVAQQPGTRNDALERLERHVPPATAVPGTVKITTRPTDSAPRNARVDTPDSAPGAVLTVAARDLAQLSAADQSTLAGWAEVPLSVVRDAIVQGRPLAVSGLASAAAARQQLTALGKHVSVPLQLTTPPSLIGLVGLAGLGALGVATIGVAVVLGVYWAALFSLVFFALGLVSAGAWLAGARQFTNARAALPIATSAMPVPLDRALKRAAALRRRVASIELPNTAAVDVREAISAIEDEIAAVARVQTAIDDADALTEAMQPIRAALDALETDIPTDARLVPEARLERVHQATVTVRRTLGDAGS